MVRSVVGRFNKNPQKYFSKLKKVSSIILAPVIPEVMTVFVLVRFCHTLPGFQAKFHVKALTMEYYSHECYEIISKSSLQL